MAMTNAQFEKCPFQDSEVIACRAAQLDADCSTCEHDSKLYQEKQLEADNIGDDTFKTRKIKFSSKKPLNIRDPIKILKDIKEFAQAAQDAREAELNGKKNSYYLVYSQSINKMKSAMMHAHTVISETEGIFCSESLNELDEALAKCVRLFLNTIETADKLEKDCKYLETRSDKILKEYEKHMSITDLELKSKVKINQRKFKSPQKSTAISCSDAQGDTTGMDSMLLLLKDLAVCPKKLNGKNASMLAIVIIKDLVNEAEQLNNEHYEYLKEYATTVSKFITEFLQFAEETKLKHDKVNKYKKELRKIKEDIQISQKCASDINL